METHPFRRRQAASHPNHLQEKFPSNMGGQLATLLSAIITKARRDKCETTRLTRNNKETKVPLPHSSYKLHTRSRCLQSCPPTPPMSSRMLKPKLRKKTRTRHTFGTSAPRCTLQLPLDLHCAGCACQQVVAGKTGQLQRPGPGLITFGALAPQIPPQLDEFHRFFQFLRMRAEHHRC